MGGSFRAGQLPAYAVRPPGALSSPAFAAARVTRSSPFDYCAAALCIAITTGSFTIADRVLYGAWSGKSGDKFTQLVNLMLIAGSLMLFCQRLRTGPRGVQRGEWLVLALGIFLLVSVSWSIDPATSLRRAVLYAVFLMMAVGTAGRLAPNDLPRLFRLVAGMAAIISLGLYVASPGLVTDDGDFIGIYAQKNVLGQVMAAGVLACLHGMRLQRQRMLNVCVLCLCAVTAALSKSATSLILITAYCVGSCTIGWWQRGGGARMLAGLIAALLTPLLLVFVTMPGVLLELLGKDPTLTGRTDLWALVWPDIWLRPVLGWGLTAFWIPGNPAADEISTTLGWVVPEAHNGLLEVLLELGFVGLAVFGAILLRAVIVGARSLHTRDAESGVTLLLCCAGIFLSSVSEQVLVDHTQVSVAMFFMTLLVSERACTGPRQAAASNRRWSQVGGRERHAAGDTSGPGDLT